MYTSPSSVVGPDLHLQTTQRPAIINYILQQQQQLTEVNVLQNGWKSLKTAWGLY